MRKMLFTTLTISLLIAVSIIGCEADKPAPKSKTLYVQAAGGLRMRQTPDLDAERILTIPDGAAVKVLKTDPMRLELSGKSGKWTYVSYGLTSGWVFGGFLTPDSVWGPMEGEMSWQAARELCASQGRRLPTLDQLVRAYDAGSDAWGAHSYWSAEEASPEEAVVMNMYDMGYQEEVSKDYKYHVRCHR